ncbi:MAG: BamA/TamA family outer membrane protein [Acidobacteria bacterium]|nr:BamA/TamA family outer membrane protein [Acidobacteriota bacterium]
MSRLRDRAPGVGAGRIPRRTSIRRRARIGHGRTWLGTGLGTGLGLGLAIALSLPVRAAAAGPPADPVAPATQADTERAHASPHPPPTPAETVVDLRVHGNQTLSDAEVTEIAGVAVGDVVDAAALDAVTRRLERSGRFESVEVRKRYRSLTATDRIALVIVVEERPGASIANPLLRSLAGLAREAMFLPILGYEEGYGLTYGARATIIDTWGSGVRLSTPVTWGGDRRAAFEAERALPGRIVDRVRAGASRGRRQHPTFGVDDDRTRAWVAVDRRLPGRVRVSAETGREAVRFGRRDETLTRSVLSVGYGGASGSFPRDTVVASASIERIELARAVEPLVRPHVDVQAFKGVGGQAVLAARVRYAGASGALPRFEQTLLGGGGMLRGWEVGARVDDQVLAASLELRMPVGSPLSAGNAGIRIFYDTGAAYGAGQSIADVPLLKGAGAGLFLLAPLGARLDLDVAHDFAGGVRLHFGAGVRF